MVVRVADYQLIAGHLYKMGTDSILRRCVLEHERPKILVESHEGIAGGHYAGKATTQKVLRTDYGGQQSIKMPRNIASNVMSVRGLENPTEGMRCL
jgi:hypothetical protein